MKRKLDNYIITYFEQTLLENLCRRCYFNTAIDLEEFKKISIFNDNNINIHKMIYGIILFSITIILKLHWSFYIADLIIYTTWYFDPFFIHQNKTFKKSLKFISISIIHSLSFGRKSRNEEIIAFLLENRQHVPAVLNHSNGKLQRQKQYQFRFNKLENQKTDLSDDSLEEFVSFFNRDYSKGLTKYIKERLNNNLNKKRDMKFLLALYLTPKRNKISFETLQQISTMIYKELCRVEINTNELTFDPEQLIAFFYEYNEQQLKKLFSSNFNANDYFLILKNSEIVAPIFPNFDELISFLNKIHVDFKYPPKIMDQNTLLFNTQENRYVIRLIANVNNLVNLSKTLSNCLSSKESKCLYGDYIVFEIVKNSYVYGAVAFNLKNKGNQFKLELSEIKGKANVELPELERNAITTFIIKTMNSTN